MLMVENVPVAEVARQVGCSRAYVYRIANYNYERTQNRRLLERILAEQVEIKSLLRDLLGQPRDIIQLRLKEINGGR